MMEGKDIIAKAPTGTGKTCAFGIPLILGLDQSRNYPQAVVMAPTRELAQQITEDLQDLAHFYPDIRVVTVYGGANIQKQIEKLKKGAQIVVATPGRLQDHMNRRTVDLSHVTTVVLDEADEMLNMGFYKDVRKILDQIKSRQRLAMFSATISREVMDIGWLYQRDAEEITVQPVEDSAPRIDQYLVLTTGRNKLADMAEIIVQKGYKRVMVFCNQKYTTAMLANQMAWLNFVVDCLHGDLSQAERNKKLRANSKRAISLCWWRQTWPPAASTCPRWTPCSTTMCRTPTNITRTASAAQGARSIRARPMCCTRRKSTSACATCCATPATPPHPLLSMRTQHHPWGTF